MHVLVAAVASGVLAGAGLSYAHTPVKNAGHATSGTVEAPARRFAAQDFERGKCNGTCSGKCHAIARRK